VKRFSLLKKKISTVSTACDSGSGRWHRSIASSSCSGDDPPIAAGTAGQFECRQAQEKKLSFCCIVFCAKKTITLFSFFLSNIELVLLMEEKKKKALNIMTMRKGLYNFPAVSYFSSCWLCAGNKREKLWQEFFSDPSQWWDNRFKKVGQ
jgi:hypothetical protein